MTSHVDPRCLSVQKEGRYNVVTCSACNRTLVGADDYEKQESIRKELGYASVKVLNEEHDAFHIMVGRVFGFPSPTLMNVIHDNTKDYGSATLMAYEEDAVKALQKLANRARMEGYTVWLDGW